MYRVLSLLLVLLPSLAFAQPRGGQWQQYAEGGCVGGSRCPNRRLTLPLQDRTILAVTFKAHDQIGETAGGVLRVKIDGTTIRGYIDIPRAGETFTIDVEELNGRQLIFEPVTNDEVEISAVGVLYSRDNVRRIPRERRPGGGSGGGWRAYPSAKGCIGGDNCRNNGTRLTIALDDRPVLGVRFFAHDDVGDRADGKVRVRIDDTTIGWTMDVQRNGKLHEIEVDRITGSRLVIENASKDEIDIRDVEVLYGIRGAGIGDGDGGYGSNYPREITHEGDCIGGSECGGRRARIRIPLHGYPVESVRFYARDDIGTRAGGELRIRVDDEILRDYLDIPREGKTFTIEGRGIAGDYLYIEPAEDDEVEVKNIRIKFGEED